jgi:hypothetical protein
MRIKLLIVSSLLLLAILAVDSYSIDRSNPDTQSVDQMLSSDPVGGPSLSQQAQASRTAKTAQTGSEAEKAKVIVQPTVTNTAAESQTDSMSVSGQWSLQIADSTVKSATLTLYQIDDAVFGKGALSEDGDTLTLTASGSVTGNKLNLDLVTLEKIGLFRISMTVNENSAIGSYTAYSPLASSSTGTATGLRSTSSS